MWHGHVLALAAVADPGGGGGGGLGYPPSWTLRLLFSTSRLTAFTRSRQLVYVLLSGLSGLRAHAGEVSVINRPPESD